LTELQRSSLDAQETAQNNLQDWLRGVVSNLQEVEVRRRTIIRAPLCKEARNDAACILSGVHLRELDLSWLNKINFKSTSTELDLMQRNDVLEKENKKLKKELLEQKLLLLENKSSTEAKLEEARVGEENLIRSNEDFKREMKQQTEETNKMMKQMMEMFQKQAQP
jgi:flagellar motor protein MotB